MYIGFDPCTNAGLSDGDHHTSVSFDFNFSWVQSPFEERINLKCCGVGPMYAHPMDSKPNTFTINALPTTEEECRQLPVEAHDEAGTSGTAAGSGSIEKSNEEKINAPQQQSNRFLSQIFVKTRNLVAAGGLMVLAFGVFLYTKRVASGTNKLQVSSKSKQTSKNPEESKPL